MGDNRGTHPLEMSRHRGVRGQQTQMGENKITHKLKMKRQRGILGQQTQMGEDKSTHFLEITDNGRVEDSKHRWGRTKARTA